VSKQLHQQLAGSQTGRRRLTRRAASRSRSATDPSSSWSHPLNADALPDIRRANYNGETVTRANRGACGRLHGPPARRSRSAPNRSVSPPADFDSPGRLEPRRGRPGGDALTILKTTARRSPASRYLHSAGQTRVPSPPAVQRRRLARSTIAFTDITATTSNVSINHETRPRQGDAERTHPADGDAQRGRSTRHGETQDAHFE